MSKIRIFPILVSLWFILFQACKTSQSASDQPKPVLPKIAFLNYHISMNNNKTAEVRLIQKSIVGGTIKEKGILEGIVADGDLKVSQLNSRLIPVAEVQVKNPLQYYAEFADDTGKLSGQEVNVSRADFLVRMQLQPDTKYIAISRYHKNQYIFISKDSL